MRNCVNTDPIEIKLFNRVSDPILQGCADILIILIEVRQVSKAAILYLILIVPVVNLALVVIVRALIEWCHELVAFIDPSYVICDDVQHHPDSFGVSGIDQVH